VSAGGGVGASFSPSGRRFTRRHGTKSFGLFRGGEGERLQRAGSFQGGQCFDMSCGFHNGKVTREGAGGSRAYDV